MPTTPSHPRRGISLGTVTNSEQVTCRVCGRRLLAGERSIGLFEPSGHGPFDTCELCLDRAAEYGLTSEPPATTDTPPGSFLRRLLRRPPERSTLARTPGAPIQRPVGSSAVPLALRAFNRSDHVRTLRGLHRSLGTPEVQVAPTSATDSEIAILVVWDVAWYEYRISPEAIRWRNGNPNSMPHGLRDSAPGELTPQGQITLAQPLGEAVAPAQQRKATT